MNWAGARSAELRAPGDARTILAWQPFFYLPRIERSYREARVAAGAAVTLVEAGLEDAFRKAVSEDRMLIGLVESPKLRYRASLRSKRSSGGLIDGMARGLKMLDSLAAVPQGILGDPHFEQYFEVTAPSAAEAQMAIPVPLRALLVQAGFHGIVELRTGAALFTLFDAPRFEPQSLDRALDLGARIAAALP